MRLPSAAILLLIAFTLTTMTQGATDTGPAHPDREAIVNAARAAGKIYFPRAEKRKKDFGFEEKDAFATATFGLPIQMEILDEKDLASPRAGSAVTNLLRPTGVWFVPVEMNGVKRAMIEVTGAEGKWSGTAFGMAPLARQWQNISQWWPARDGLAPRLFICPPAQGYFFTVPQSKGENATPVAQIPDTIQPPQKARPELRAAVETFDSIRDLVKQTKGQTEGAKP
jgi:hypothetical protein